MSQKAPQTLADLFREAVHAHQSRPCFGIVPTAGDAPRAWCTYLHFGLQARFRAEELLMMGVKRGDRVGFIGNNSYDWALTAFACYSIGAVFVPMYSTQKVDDWAYIVNDCTPKVLFVSSAAICETMLASGAGKKALRWIIVTDIAVPLDRFAGRAAAREQLLDPTWPERADLPTERAYSIGMHDLYMAHADAARPPKGRPHEFVAPRPEADDPACLIYTSGTSGKPKGVIQTHRNIVSNVLGVADLGFAEPGDTSVAFLPWAHAFGHTADLHVMLHRGCAIAICEDRNALLSTLKEVKPTVLCVVPKVLERVCNETRGKASKSAVGKYLLPAAVAARKRRNETGSAGLLGSIILLLASLFIFREVRNYLGGRVRHLICGGAALPPHVADFMEAAEIPVHIGYGMTEASPVITVTRPGDRKLGTSGKPIAGVSVTIDTSVFDEPGVGEVVVRGPNVTQGYYNLPEETAKAIMTDGALRTGDLGRFDEQGNLVIIGRNSERFKLSNGEWVAPVPLEEKILTSPLVANVMLFGQDRPHLIAVVVPNAKTLPTDGDAKKLLLAEVQKCIEGCKAHERVRGIVLAEEDFTQENGLLTPTLKVKRIKVVNRWQTAIDQVYS